MTLLLTRRSLRYQWRSECRFLHCTASIQLAFLELQRHEDKVESKKRRRHKGRMHHHSDEEKLSSKLNPAAYLALLRQCQNTRALVELRRLHVQIVRSGYAGETILANVLVQMYGKCGSLEDARLVFESLENRNSYSWNVMITACIQNGDLGGARHVLQTMPREDAVASNCMITAYGKSRHIQDARSMFESMSQRNAISWTAMLTAYAQNGHVQDARKIFDKMPERGVMTCTCMVLAYAQNGQVENGKVLFDEMGGRDGFSWVTLISGYARQGLLEPARAVFDKMPHLNNVAWTTIITAYAKNGYLQEARCLFDKMPDADVVTWTSLITSYAQKGHSKEALDMFRMMDLQGIEADKFTFSIILDACASLSAIAEGRILHDNIVNCGITDVVVGNSLLNMYGKCGDLEEAIRVFEKMPRRVVATWNALIAAHTENGWDKEAFQVFGSLIVDGGVQPNEITFTGIFTACSHTGLLSDGWHYFLSMMRDFNVMPVADHYVSLADLLGRVGRLADVEELINNMPFHPDPVAWLSLLGACRTHLDADRAERAAEHVFELDPECPSPYILLSNIYAALGRKKDVLRIRKLMKDRGVKNKRALSSVQVKDRLLPFAVSEWTRKYYREQV